MDTYNLDRPIDELIEERVANGVAWLDETIPGWRDLVDSDILDMSAPDLCIIGQISYFNYCLFIDEHGMDGSNRRLQVARGFESMEALNPKGVKYALAEIEYSLLRMEWIKYL